MEFIDYLVWTIAAITIAVAIVMSNYVFKVKPLDLFKYLGFLVKSLIALLTVVLLVGGTGILGTSLIALLMRKSVLPGLVGLAVLMLVIGAAIARSIGFGIMADDDVDLDGI